MGKPTGFYTGPCYNNILVTKSASSTLPSNVNMRFADIYTGCTAPTTTTERFAGNNTAAATPLIQLNQWYSVVWTSDGINERIYVNCELKITAPAGGVPYSNTFDIFFGRQNVPGFEYWLNGDLDEIRLYDRALTPDEVNTLGGCPLTTSCNNWLSTPSNPSYATIGDLDVSGNQLTIEATYNRTGAFNSGIYPGHLVSKHTNVSDDNYSLFPNGCALTTTNGYKSTFETCGLGLNKTYHVAMVYDGSFLKFYRNGFLLTQTACTGNLILNNLPATIAQYTGLGSDQQFIGNVNEVRIWNVARTQAQLQTYMNSSLPNPTTTAGLLAYYTFDNLLNKQGNATFNATLAGAATINATNPNCTFVADSCIVPFTCNNWLQTQAVGQSVTVGDLDISGNQVTVEANFNCSSFPLTRPDKQEDIVSKHSTTTDINYVLRMDLAGITTTNGQFLTPIPCDNLVLNKTYHVAMVYNGSSLKFYRDGFLMSQVAASGNLILNNWQTTIGDYAVNNPVGTNFLGYINEVRIWNVARTQSQIQAFMNNSLPNPTTQTGLQGYYTFDNLVNKQGNTAWNGTLNGAATINNTNPNCNFTADSCAVVLPPTNISNIINSYTPVLALSPCDNKLTVEDASTFNVGDTVLLIQMKGAEIDSTNTAAFGTITNYKNAGNYEFNYVKTKAGNIIELKNIVTRQYDLPTGKVQLVRVPYFNSANVGATLTCLPWDGRKGGVLVFNVQDTLNLNADIDVSGKGFRGGQAITTTTVIGIYDQTDYAYPYNLNIGASKGEGIAEVSANLIFCRGPLASGGGGGNSHNAGGGGGGNGGSGGKGGDEWQGTPLVLPVGGIGGKNLTGAANNKIFMGGGGGAGQNDNGSATSGGKGGGIVIINAGFIEPNLHKMIANGLQAPDCINIITCADGVGGGGAGGTVLINTPTIISNAVIQANGGKGADNNISGPNAHGTGGGGAGGNLFVDNATLLSNITYLSTGGVAGRALNQGGTNWGATAGANGISASNVVIPFSTTPFVKNIDSVRIKDSITACLNVDFKGFGYTNTNPVAQWQWYFGDGGTAGTQNTAHAYGTAGTYTVKLVVTDINGCNDSLSKPVTVSSCTGISNIINTYTPVLGLNPCDNKLTVEDGTTFNVGDTVLLIQMKGAVIDSTNTSAFGTMIDYKNSGNYEMNYVKTRSGNNIELKNVLTRQYDLPNGRVQLVRVPYYTDANVTGTLTCLPWDGSKGGILAFNVANNLTLNADIDVSAKGFKGSFPITNIPSATQYNQTDYAYPANIVDGSRKGEGIAEVSENIIYCRGPLFFRRWWRKQP